MMFGSMLKEMDDIEEFMRIHPSATLLMSEGLEISNSVNIGTQPCVNITSWMSEGRRYPKPKKKKVA